jgi:hypothetical protein
MAYLESGATDEVFSLEHLHSLTAPTARYAQYSPEVAWSILRSGFVEEGLESIIGVKDIGRERSDIYLTTAGKNISPAKLHEKEGEIGDGLYYISEISRFGQAASAEVLQGHAGLATLQKANPGIKIPIYNHDGESLTLEQDDRAVIGHAIMRAVDVLNPKTPELWIGTTERPSLGVALGDVTGAYAYYANQYDISLVKAIQHVVQKLETRERPPDVIAQADKNERLPVSSGRGRLEIIPWVGELINRAALAQWEMQASQHPARPIA